MTTSKTKPSDDVTQLMNKWINFDFERNRWSSVDKRGGWKCEALSPSQDHSICLNTTSNVKALQTIKRTWKLILTSKSFPQAGTQLTPSHQSRINILGTFSNICKAHRRFHLQNSHPMNLLCHSQRQPKIAGSRSFEQKLSRVNSGSWVFLT